MSTLESNKLPPNFTFKMLSTKYLNEIFTLLNNHYIEDDICRLTYTKEFLYWYIKSGSIMLGLLYKNKLVGLISAITMDISVVEKVHKVAYVNFLCVHKKIRGAALGKYLVNEICNRVDKNIFFTKKKLESDLDYFCTTTDYIIPINEQKLRRINFLSDEDELEKLPLMTNNLLHLMSEADIKFIVPKLNAFMNKYAVKPIFSNDMALNYLLPKKNIVYSFVNRSKDTMAVTDFICVYKTLLYALEKQEYINIANVAFYYHETMNLTELIANLIDKLRTYDFDQLVFRNMADNTNINITKFSSYGELNYFLPGIHVDPIDSSKICIFPF